MLVYQRVLDYDYWLVVWNMAFIFSIHWEE